MVLLLPSPRPSGGMARWALLRWQLSKASGHSASAPQSSKAVTLVGAGTIAGVKADLQMQVLQANMHETAPACKYYLLYLHLQVWHHPWQVRRERLGRWRLGR